MRTFDICIVGGCGHVGLPLGLAFAHKGKNVVLYDINKTNVERVNNGEMPFLENGAPDMLQEVLAADKLRATLDPEVISESEVIIMVIGTPVDEHLNPKLDEIFRAVAEVRPHLDSDQLLVMRSTLFPGTTTLVHESLRREGLYLDVAFCPERIAEGYALTELFTLPQIVSGCTPAALKRAGELFSTLAPEVIDLSPKEAELAKLYANVWRYMTFGIANEFYMIAEAHDADFHRIRSALTKDYPRLQGLPGPGLAAGPCLFKDTMQLAAFSGGRFFLGHAAMLVNEGLPDFIVDRLKQQLPNLRSMTVGVLGMAFKPNNDDPRESLSYKLRKKLELTVGRVVCTDVHIQDPSFISVNELVRQSDIVIVATPHREYQDLDLGGKIVVDMWNFYGNGAIK